MIHDRARVRRLLVLSAAAVALVAISGGSLALAGNGQTTPTAAVVATPTAAGVATPSAPFATTSAPAAGGGNPFDAAVQALVDEGAINQHQADVLRQHIDEGSIDPQQLVDSGVLTAAEMKVVATRLDAVKQSLATGPEGTAPPASSATTKTSQGDAARAAATAAHAAFDAAVEALVDDGTIDQAQADVLRPHIDAGSIDEQELIDSGVLTAAQMQAVQARLSAVKQSLAAGAVSQVPPVPENAQPTGSSGTESDDAKRAEKEAAAASEAAAAGEPQPTGAPPTK